MTNNIAIKVEGLGKRYRLGEYVGSGAQYKTLRESLTNVVSAPLRRFRWTRDGRRKTGPQSPVPGQPSTNRFLWALKDVSFEVEQGEILGIIGKNGAGKSTLLKVLTQITEPTEGRAELNGRVGSLLEVGTGFHPELTGRENIRLSGAILGMTRKEIDRKFDEIVDFSGVETYIDTPVKRYSSGMHVRLGFAVAVHLELEILLIDEVLAVGDATFQKKCLGKMGNVASEGRTVLLVSHNMSSIRALCSKGLLLENGQVKFNDNIDSTIGEYLSSTSRTTNNPNLSERRRPSRCSLRAKIVRIDVIADGKKNTNRLDSKKPFTVRLTVQSSSDSTIECSAQVKISDEMQPLIFFDSATLHNKFYSIKKGISQIDCAISSPYLYGGNYKISCGLTVPAQEVIDYVENAYSFDVIAFDPYNTGYDLKKSYGFGLFHVDHQWKKLVELGNEDVLN